MTLDVSEGGVVIFVEEVNIDFCMELVKAGVLFAAVVVGKTANQYEFKACPVQYGYEEYCCEVSRDVKYVMQRYSRPTKEGIAKYYEQGWGMSRQINYPYAFYTPDSPEFRYDVSNEVCRLVETLNGENGVDVEMVCGGLENVENSGVFYTYAANPRNNNASCPIGANFTSLMDPATNKVDLDRKKRCAPPSSVSSSHFSTFSEWEMVLIYVVYAALFVLMAAWYGYKSWTLSKLLAMNDVKLLNNKQGSPSGRSSLTHVEDPIKVVESEVTQLGYVNSGFGTALMGFFILLTLGLHVMMVVIIADNYGSWGVQLLTPGEPLLSVFMTVWFIATFWLGAIVILQNQMRNFFRLRAPLKHCSHVYFFKPEHSKIMLADRSGVSQFVAKVENFLLPSYESGHEETLPVVKSKQGSSIVEFQHLRYYYSEQSQRFIPGTISLGKTYRELHDESTLGLSDSMHAERFDAIGANSIEIQMPSWITSCIGEFFTFFYIYQVMCYYVWYYFSYWNMGLVMTIVVVVSALINILTKRRIQATVVNMTKYSTKVDVRREQDWESRSSKDLVPGDIVRVGENWVLPCDMIIVKGSTVCDESMLTGESMPVQKFAIPQASNDDYDSLGNGKKYTLFSGTKVLSSGRNEEIIAMVQKTGAHTSKGQLVQDILYPVPMRFKYDEHLKVVLAGLFVYGIVACYFVIIFLTSNENLTNRLNAWTYCIFMLSGILSPLLPVVITVGQVAASNRLEKLGVFALNAQRITLSGKIRIFCFDKTGTLTKDGLDYLGCQPAQHSKFQDVAPANATLKPEMEYALASCHALGALEGELVGNQVEMKMFNATGWTLLEREGDSPMVHNTSGKKLQFVHRFEFDHHRMSMSVIVKDLVDGNHYVFCKGSYEKIKSLSSNASLPENYSDVAESSARNGCYVLGMGMRRLPNMNEFELLDLIRDRDAVEKNLEFLGLIYFRNELKDDSRNAIQELKKGDTRVVMITGDNAMCGCYIARESAMVEATSSVILADVTSNESGDQLLQWCDVDTQKMYSMDEVKALIAKDRSVELAVTGAAFDMMTENGKMKELLLRIRIFSRMSPDGKVTCVKMHMDTGAITGMCGDGGNDCGALRIAHAGVALSDAEASIVSPFTSKTKRITSVVDLCREGRCSVATSFASVKMLIMYGLVASTLRFVQYYNGIIMSEWCFILADGFILVGLSYVITLSRPLKFLNDQRPTSSLIGPTTLLSIFGQEFINVIFLYFAMNHLLTQAWYCPFAPTNVDAAKWWLLSDNAIATCVFYCVIIQQQTAAFVFSFGSRYRQPVWRNYALMLFYVVLILLDFYLILGEPSSITDLFRIASSTNVVGLPDIPLPYSFRLEYFFIVAGNMLAVILFEYLVILGPVRNCFRAKFHKDHIPMIL